MPDPIDYERRREALKQQYLHADRPRSGPVTTGGVDHLALICSDLDATIRFYTEVLDMRLTAVIPNRDEPSSTHIFFDMGGGNLLAFFDFPEKSTGSAKPGTGGMHHLALKSTPENYRALIARLEEKNAPYSLNGTEDSGSVYLRDPDDILVEVTTGYDL